MRFGFLYCALLLLLVAPASADDFCKPGYVVSINNNIANGYECKIDCSGGTYLAVANAPECIDVGPGYWAPASTIKQGATGRRNKCPVGLTTVGYGAGADEASDCGRILRIGDEKLYLSSERVSVPGFATEVNGQNFYAGITKIETAFSDDVTRKLVVLGRDDKKYFVYDTTLKEYVLEHSAVFDYSDYEITDGKLLFANPDVYLESTGDQYINTLARGNTQYKYEIDYQMTSIMANPIWGMRNMPVWNKSAVFFYSFQNDKNTIVYIRSDTEPVKSGHIIAGGNNLSKVHLLIDIPNSTVLYNDKAVKFPATGTWETDYDLYLFNNNIGGDAVTKPVSAKIYSYKVYDADDNLIMHLVPVPRGLQIGEFTVPGTGMWDTVSQTYFPNQGSGFFLYGKD